MRHLSFLRRVGSDNLSFEVKKAQGGLPATVWETVSAFANADGGILLLGVDEKQGFAVVGVNDAGRMESQLAVVCSEMEPPVRAEISSVLVADKTVVTCVIPRTPRDQRPCHRKSLGPYGGSRFRVADGDRKLTDYEVHLLLSNRAENRHDLMPISAAGVESLNSLLINAFLHRIRETKGAAFHRLTDTEVLKTLNVVVSHRDRLVPTLAGLLTFGVYPQSFEPQLNVTFVAYPTLEPGVPGPRGERFLDNRSIDGPIPVMVAECIGALKRNMRRRSTVTGLFRTDEWEYPEEVLREALVNALVHRDYSEQARGCVTVPC